MIRLMTPVEVKSPQIEISPGLEVCCERAGSNRSQRRSLHPHKCRPRQGLWRQLSITTAFQIARPILRKAL